METQEITLSCPACGKRQPLPPAGVVLCPRCQCDLTRLREIAHQAREAVRTGEAYLRSGQGALAMGQASSAWALRHTPEAGKLGFLAAASCQDLRGMRCWLVRMGKPGKDLQSWSVPG